MLPISEIHIVACGIATVAATLGYNFTKRRVERSRTPSPAFDTRDDKNRRQTHRSTLMGRSRSRSASMETSWLSFPINIFHSDAPHQYDALSQHSRPLKRKSSDDDETQLEEKPRKRSRTPPYGSHESMSIMEADPPVYFPEMSSSSPPLEKETIRLAVGEMTADVDVCLVGQTSEKSSQFCAATPIMQGSGFGFSVPPKRAVVPSASRGFAEFAGAESSLRLNGLSQQSPLYVMQPAVNSQDSHQMDRSIAVQEVQNALDPLCNRIDVKSSYNHFTGEEDEEVLSDLKGVKLFIKRGNREFTDGMAGHMKLLSHRKTFENRLLFRREPLWQVSMNVRLKPTVRCTFDREERILRLALKEPIERKEVDPKNWPLEMVVYAFKAGRSSKDEFSQFAESLMKNEHLTVPVI